MKIESESFYLAQTPDARENLLNYTSVGIRLPHPKHAPEFKLELYADCAVEEVQEGGGTNETQNAYDAWLVFEPGDSAENVRNLLELTLLKVNQYYGV